MVEIRIGQQWKFLHDSNHWLIVEVVSFHSDIVYGKMLKASKNITPDVIGEAMIGKTYGFNRPIPPDIKGFGGEGFDERGRWKLLKEVKIKCKFCAISEQ